MKNNTVRRLLGILVGALLGICVNMVPGISGILKFALILTGAVCLKSVLNLDSADNL